MTFAKWFFVSLLYFQCSFANASGYNRAFVTQCLEEQSYTALLSFVQSVPAEECDNYLLNAAGYSAYQTGLTEQAAQYYSRSFGKDSNNIQANLYLGIIKKQQRRFPEALEYYKRLLQLKPDQARYLKNVADCFSSLKNEDSAVYYLSMAYKTAPSDLSIAYSYADALYAKKKFEESDIVVTAGLSIDSNNASLLGVGIRSAYFQKKYKAVLPMVNKLSGLGLGETIYTPMVFGVLAALQVKDYKQCIEYSDYLMRNGSEAEQVYYYAAKAYAGMKEYEKSNELLKRCLSMAISENTEAYYTEMAENYESLRAYSKAQKNYDTARFISGNNLLLYRKALAYEAASDTEKAKKAYHDFLKFSRNEDTAIVNFARKRITQL